MAKGLTPLLFYSESCAQPTNNGLKSGFVDIGHSSPTLEVADSNSVRRTTTLHKQHVYAGFSFSLGAIF
jgi:hypothetical protein